MPNILILDDEDYVRNRIKETLKKNNYKIFEAQNGDEGLKIIKKDKIDLVIIDIVMPQKSGIDILIELKKNNNIKKILITGKVLFEKNSLKDMAAKFGVKHVLHKPFTKEELMSAVEDSLSKK